MKKIATLLAAVVGLSAASALANDPLELDTSTFRLDSLQMPDGQTVRFKAYEGMNYVTNVEDPQYQTLNIYIPEKKADGRVPILLRTYVGGYMASAAKTPSAFDATGRALEEGYVVCIPGSRGSNSTVSRDGKTLYTGKCPNTILDLKAAIRYLRHNRDRIEGDTDLIFTDGTSAGGAMSALMGATGNADIYEPYLKAMGAADERDDVYAAICYCPITDLNHADMEYEWLYGCTDSGVRHLDNAQMAISQELALLCPDYINSLALRSMRDGSPITADNYKDYLKTYIAASAHKALEEGCAIPDSIGIDVMAEQGFGMPPSAMRTKNERLLDGTGAPDGRRAPSFGPAGRVNISPRQSDFVKDVDLDKYLTWVATQTPLKTPPAFDSYGVLVDNPSPENSAFGNSEGEPANFTDFSLRKRLKDPTASLSDDMVKRVMLYNPMDFIGTEAATVAPKWYIRHGAKDRDTSFLVPLNLATKLQNSGAEVNFFIPWNRPHSGDYNLDDLFTWIKASL